LVKSYKNFLNILVNINFLVKVKEIYKKYKKNLKNLYNLDKKNDKIHINYYLFIEKIPPRNLKHNNLNSSNNSWFHKINILMQKILYNFCMEKHNLYTHDHLSMLNWDSLNSIDFHKNNSQKDKTSKFDFHHIRNNLI
jgi:hypothetical protein